MWRVRYTSSWMGEARVTSGFSTICRVGMVLDVKVRLDQLGVMVVSARVGLSSERNVTIARAINVVMAAEMDLL